MRHVALRLMPGEDLRGGIEAAFEAAGARSGFVAAAVGSLTNAALRYASLDGASEVAGPLEILSLSGTLSPDGPHLHLSVAGPNGVMRGGHLLRGSPVRTTAELVLALSDTTRFARETDPVTGWKELVFPDRP
ncbi:DNA-binding protein [Pelagovum pacificum]|uniref:DNA-binding protein n=1 Tax=Pelagovum pacificum TaxID=2588711 RepID=A0A5C5GHY6_9RHOB|nr:DNA-binding protein [Pelagovum pacificum]